MPLLDELQRSVEAYNRFLADVWQAKQQELVLRLDALAADLAASEKRIQRVDEIRLHAESPPALAVEKCADARGCHQLRIAIPGSGSWRFFIRLRASILGVHTFEVDIGRLNIDSTLKFARTSRTRARLLPGSRTRVRIRDFDPDSSNLLADALLSVAGPILKRILRRLMRKAIAGALPSFEAVERIERLSLADVAPRPKPASSSMRDLARRADEISALVQAEHLPFRSLLSVRLSGPDAADPLETYAHFHDSAIWTGHYVAAEAYRHASSSGAAAQSAADNAMVGLRGLEAMIHISGRKGLLSRVLVRSDSEHRLAMAIEAAHPTFTGSFRGVEYVSQTHITRDQFAGAFLGAGTALRLIGRDDVRTLAARLVRDMTAYLIEVDWCPEEAIVDPGTGIRNTSVTYLGAPSHVLAILQLARKVDPAAWEEPFQRHRALSPVSWLAHWLQTLDPHSSYYKFNLEHGMALLLLGLEEDAAAREELSDGFRAMRSALRFHANAYFNLVELTVFADRPDLLSRPQEEIEEETRRLMSGWLERPPIMEPMDRTEDEALETVPYLGLSDTKKSQAETIARLPVEVAERPGTDFLWQRSPFELVSLAIDPARALRPPGVDFLLPYWMGRKLGVFTAR